MSIRQFEPPVLLCAAVVVIAPACSRGSFPQLVIFGVGKKLASNCNHDYSVRINAVEAVGSQWPNGPSSLKFCSG